MPIFYPDQSGGTPVRVAHVRRGHVLVDAENVVVLDEFGEPITFSTRDEAQAALAASSACG